MEKSVGVKTGKWETFLRKNIWGEKRTKRGNETS